MSRPRLPDAVKAARGTLKPCRMNPLQPKLEATGIPAPPDFLAGDQAKAWLDLAARVEPLRVFTVADDLAFEQAAVAIALSRRLSKSKKAGTNERINASKNVGYWLTHFGLSPSTRSKVSAVPAPAKADPLAEFLS